MTELWEHTLLQLQGSALDEEIYLPLKLSYNSLPSEIHQRCFLFCSLYPENNSINTRELIQCWRADGLVDDNQTMENSFNSGLALIEDLKDSCMLEQGDRLGSVKMHNVVRDVAIRIATESGLCCQAGATLTEMKSQNSFTRISLMNNNITRLSSQLLRCPDLTVLFLQGNPIEKIPDYFFSEVRALRVLNLSRTPVKSLPASLLHLEKLKTLLLQECYNLKKLPPLGDLYELQVLDLSGAQIRELPWNMRMLSNLRELNLSHTQYLENIDAGTISGLVSLEVLDMSFSAYKWDARANVGEQRAAFDELLPLKQLSTLHIRLDTVERLPLEINWLKRLRKFNIRVSPRSCKPDYMPTQNDEKRVTLRGVDLMREGLQGLLCNASALEVINCGGADNLSEVVIRNKLKGLSGLKSLIVSSCDGFTSLINGEITRRDMLPNLEHLKLIRSSNLETILEGILPPGGCLGKLKTMEVVDCPRLTYPVSFALLRQFQNLEKIRIGNCKRINILVTTKANTVLPKLRVIEMWDMIHLRRVCSRTTHLPALERIEVRNCPLLEKLPISSSNAETIKEIRGELEWWEKVEFHQSKVKPRLLSRFQAQAVTRKNRLAV